MNAASTSRWRINNGKVLKFEIKNRWTGAVLNKSLMIGAEMILDRSKPTTENINTDTLTDAVSKALSETFDMCLCDYCRKEYGPTPPEKVFLAELDRQGWAVVLREATTEAAAQPNNRRP
jgi:hypothetical protein